MSVDSVLDDRYARWTTDLYDWGYVLEDPVWPAGTAAIILRARWPPGAPEIVITVHEIWLPGIDPDGLGLTGHGCYLFYAGWHAQFPSPPGEQGARTARCRSAQAEAADHPSPPLRKAQQHPPAGALPTEPGGLAAAGRRTDSLD